MRTFTELMDKLKPYGTAHWVWRDYGYLAWHVGTGGNIEALFIEAKDKGKGHGKELYRLMARQLIEEGKRPYHSVYGFRLASNAEAAGFYASMGWRQVELGKSVYAGDGAVLMWVPWDEFLVTLGIKI